ncbi:dephospho-CoA kinase [Ligilactobacillus salitolerans]|uniref:Dephospho-CoA kinase n=1 Tax=Ligilactobacillus salitolerans TaxID=1808352 RepID=A0A401IQ09_9LACO|nr:dephospho-CoA kinase [Ligilactobacillus salitolerans]GBG93627.1 dephospho-CoA kinase [Ligilactobacillus salitolerans]
MTYILGLTGGIASGKSTVSNYLYELGAVVLDADVLAREVVRPGTDGLGQLTAEFGHQILDSTGDLNRAALGQIIFENSEKRNLVDQILHPLILKEMLKQVDQAKEQDTDLVVLDVPLLFETHWDKYCDSVAVVDIAPQLQVERLMLRNGYSRKEAAARINSQMDPVKRRELADFVIDNNHSEEETFRQIDLILEKILP